MKGDIVPERLKVTPDGWPIREDMRLVGLARSLGWDVDLKGDERFLQPDGTLGTYVSDGHVRVACSGEPYCFKRPGKWVWEVQDGWRCADVSDAGVASNHRRYGSLKEALEQESEEGK